MTTQQLLVSGRVQRVGYRDWAVRKARELGVTGWVRNLSDGRVELLVTGEEDRVAAMVEAAREGPLYAEVREVHAQTIPLTNAKGFTKRFTA